MYIINDDWWNNPMLTDWMLPLQMNYTRLMWGGETDLNCTQHDRDDMPVLLTSFIILTTPLLFYGASCICGERRKLKLLTREPLSLFYQLGDGGGIVGIFPRHISLASCFTSAHTFLTFYIRQCVKILIFHLHLRRLDILLWSACNIGDRISEVPLYLFRVWHLYY